jgi:hypothetical protein
MRRDGNRKQPWVAWVWTAFALITVAIAIARPSLGQSFLAGIFVVGAGLMWYNQRRGRSGG